jgi:hypothetical protein
MFALSDEQKTKKANLTAKLKAEFELCYEAFKKAPTIDSLKLLLLRGVTIINFYEDIMMVEKTLLEASKHVNEKSFEDVSYLKAEIMIDKANIMAVSYRMKNVLDNTTLM